VIELAVICGLSIVALASLQAMTMVDRRRERQEVRAERSDLLLRVSETQQQTVIRHHQEQEYESPPAVSPEVDDDYWVSKDDLAEIAAREELANGN
jgi:hypothetical protein